MDEQNVLVHQDILDALCPNQELKVQSNKTPAESSAKEEEASSVSAEQIQTTHSLPVDSKERSAGEVFSSGPASTVPFTCITAENQKVTGDKSGQGVLRSDRKRVNESVNNETCIDGGLCTDSGDNEALGNVHGQMQVETTLDVCAECISSSQHIAGGYKCGDTEQGNLQVNEDLIGNEELQRNAKMKQVAALHSDQQLSSCASTRKGIMLANDVDDVQAGATDFVDDFMMDEGRQGEASLEMLSGAVESFENMQRQSVKGLDNINKIGEVPDAVKEHAGNDFENALVNAEKHLTSANYGTLKSLMNKSTSELEDNGSSVVDSTKELREDFQHKDHFLNLLCELAAVQQHELSVMHSDQVASCSTSLVENDAASSEPRRLSFVDLLRKQMVHAGALTDLTADAFYEQFLRQNQAILGSSVAKDFNPSTASAGISSSNGAVITLEAEKKSIANHDREGDTPSNDEIMGDSRTGEVKDELVNLFVKGGPNSGDDLKEETRDEGSRFGVGDLVWAKVKSHPWWPGQIFSAADASVAAKKIQRPGRTLVAFFGDGTFGWLQQSQLIAFRPNFEEKVKQTTMKSFCRAVTEALDEVSRRMELGLRCSHFSDAMYSKDLFPDLNAGMRKGARIKSHQDITISTERFLPKRVLEFVQTAARSPFFSLNAGLERADLCGHVYGFRNYMLSPKRPKNKTAPQNMVKAQKKVKSAQSSTLKRRFGHNGSGAGPSAVQGKEAKRLHLSKDVISEQLGGSRVHSPRFRTMENLLLTESDETKTLEADVESHEQAKGGTWLAKGKRLQVSQDSKEGKRVKGWHLLGSFGDTPNAGTNTPIDSSMSPDDDTKTLFDITGLHSLKKKKKGCASKSTTETVAKKAEQQGAGVRHELLSKKPFSKFEKTGQKEGSFPDSSTSSLSTAVPYHNLSVSPGTTEVGSAEESIKAKEELRESKTDDVEDSSEDKGVLPAGDTEETENNKEKLQDLKVGDAEESEIDKGDILNLKVGEAQENESGKGNLLDSKAEVSEKDTGELLDLKVGDAEESVKEKEEPLDLKVTDAEKNKGDLLDLKAGEAEENGKVRGELRDLKESQTLLLDVIDDDVISKGKKHMKRLLSQEGGSNGLHVKAKRRRRDGRHEVEKLQIFSPKEDLGLKKLVKSSKLGVSIKKVASALKGIPASLKSAGKFSAKNPVSVTSGEFAGNKDKSLNLDHALSRNLDGENNSSFAKLLNSLQVVARDPLNSANMKGSLHGATLAFLKFRSMVFLKSSGYGAAGAGKSVIPVGNGHSFGDKKVDKAGSGKQTLPPERQRPGVPGSLGDRKAIVRTESRSECVGQGSQRQSVQETSSAAKAAAIKRPRPLSSTFGSHKSGVQNSSTDTETASGETPLYPKDITIGSQKLGVQELAVAARKKKSEVLQECAAKVPIKSDVLKGFLGKPLFKERLNKEKVADSRHHAKSVKHHISRAEILSLPEKKSPMHNPANAKVAQTALGLFMQFTEDFTLPSEVQLKEIFTRFGALETAGIRVSRNASTAQVVFKHSSDAEAAWQHAKKNRMFGHANVMYRLRHFALSSKSDSKQFTPKSSLSETGDIKSSLVENLGSTHHIRNSLSSGAERGISVVPAHSPARNLSLSRADPGGSRVPGHSPVINTSLSGADPGGSRVPGHSPVRNTSLSRAEPGDSILPAQSVGSILPAQSGGLVLPAQSPVQNLSLSSAELGLVQSPVRIPSSSVAESGGSILPVSPPVIHQEAHQCPSTDMAFSSSLLSPPSVSKVNVISGDIQDQMLRLLQQVSVIVSSSSLTPKPS